MANAEVFLSLQGLHKSYSGNVALDHISLDIKRGEFMTFLGPSGSGKSTTLYITAGFENPTQGHVLLQGKDLVSVPPSERNIGMVFQRYTLFPHLSVAENIAFPLRVRNWPQEKITARVEKMLKLIHLEGFGNRKPAALSGGQQQRVAIARALAYDPPILLMDEPLSALDKKLREELQMELRRIHQETGVTVLYVTHDQEEALRLSDRIAVFNKGRIEQVGTGPELYERPATSFVAGFIGNSNFIRVRTHPTPSSGANLQLPDGTSVGCSQVAGALNAGADGQLMIRPDDFMLASCTEASSGLGIEVSILDRSYLGDSIQFSVMTSWEQELHVRMAHSDGKNANWAPGDRVVLTWNSEHSVCYA